MALGDDCLDEKKEYLLIPSPLMVIEPLLWVCIFIRVNIELQEV